MIADGLRNLWWQRPAWRRQAGPLKGLVDNPAYQWWRDSALLQPDSWWGGAQSEGSLSAQTEIMQALGVNMFRFDAPWRALAPRRPGRLAYDGLAAARSDYAAYEWRRLDLIIDVLESASITPLPVVSYAPAWAVDESLNNPAAPPTRPEYFADFMTALVGRYKDRVRHWELWNEPDHPHSWSGTMSDYVRLVLEPGAAAVRAEAAACRVLLGGLADHRNFDASPLLARSSSYDIVSLHHYPAVASARHVRRAVNHVRAVMQRAGAHHRPIWITECGIATKPPSSPSHFGGVTDERGQERFVTSLYGTVDAEAIFLYQLRDTVIFDSAGHHLKDVYWGLMSRDWNHRKAGFEAYRRALNRKPGYSRGPDPRKRNALPAAR